MRLVRVTYAEAVALKVRRKFRFFILYMLNVFNEFHILESMRIMFEAQLEKMKTENFADNIKAQIELQKVL